MAAYILAILVLAVGALLLVVAVLSAMSDPQGRSPWETAPGLLAAGAVLAAGGAGGLIWLVT